ncbi:MAG: HNH endonuclease [Gammaproteobacteria bacterium]|nr:HNH endonuclease [Gammaproteobacteria bacterium]
MGSDYLVVIGRRDGDRFRRFCAGLDAGLTGSIPRIAGAEGIWALRASTDTKLWGSVRSGSRVFFAEHGSPFTRCGTVMSKISDRSIPARIWGDTPRMREHSRIILFSEINKVDIPFSIMIRDAGVKPSSDRTDLYMAKGGISVKEGTFLDDESGAPYRKSGVTSRFDRDRAKVEKLKSIYDGRCQICGYALRIPPGLVYSEVHHIHPLGAGGDDSLGNMIVVCPTHHKELDYKVIGIGNDGRSVVDAAGDKIGRITVRAPHRIAKKNITYHLREMRRDGA